MNGAWLRNTFLVKRAGIMNYAPTKAVFCLCLFFYYYWIARTSKLWMNRENQRYSRLSGPMLKSRSSMLRFGRKPCFASYTW